MNWRASRANLTCIGIRSEYEPANAVFQDPMIEIDEKSDLELAQAKVCQHLRLMNGRQFLDGLEFEQDLGFNDKVKAVATFAPHIAINDRESDLSHKHQRRVSQLGTKTLFVD
jgi:hypothetical protein